MASYSPSDLARQLSRNSTPYHDPVAKIRWEHLSQDHYWLPEQAISLYGMPAFQNLSDAQRRRLSQYELLNFIEAGLWLEGIFMERIARSLNPPRQERHIVKYRLHELREEAGHSLMFLELLERSGLSLPYSSRSRLHFADVFGHYAPLESVGFWMATTLGEEIPDRLNRYVRSNAAGVSPTIVEMCTMHVIDEARHIAYAREVLEQRLAALPRWRRALLRPIIQRLVRQFVAIFYLPRPALYELAGLFPGAEWARLARGNPQRHAFVDRCLNPTLHMLRSRGFAIRWR